MSTDYELLEFLRQKGTTKFEEISAATNISHDELVLSIHRLAEKELLTGYVDWQEKVIAILDADHLPTDECPSCGDPLVHHPGLRTKCGLCGTTIYESDEKAEKQFDFSKVLHNDHGYNVFIQDDEDAGQESDSEEETGLEEEEVVANIQDKQADSPFARLKALMRRVKHDDSEPKAA